MKSFERSERVSVLTNRMYNFIKGKFRLDEGVPILAGLPLGSSLHDEAKMVLATSCCSYNLFEDPMRAVSQARDCDVVLMRHGLHPETIDDVLFDVVIRVSGDRLLIRDLCLYIDEFEDAWLVPTHGGPYFAMGPDGLTLYFEAPYLTDCLRSEGLNVAAKQVVRAALGRELIHG